jgi:hypothetical protein
MKLKLFLVFESDKIQRFSSHKYGVPPLIQQSVYGLINIGIRRWKLTSEILNPKKHTNRLIKNTPDKQKKSQTDIEIENHKLGIFVAFLSKLFCSKVCSLFENNLFNNIELNHDDGSNNDDLKIRIIRFNWTWLTEPDNWSLTEPGLEGVTRCSFMKLGLALA